MSAPKSLSRKAVVPVALAAGVAMFALSTPASALPPGIPSAATAKGYLAELTVAPDGSMSGYSRDKFPTWIDQGNSCNTREVVLKRDGKNVQVGSDCYPTSGSWTSEYDGTTTSTPSKVQIDHIVPLADAWRTGASSWTTQQRQDFANDLTDPQLSAQSASSNESKGDQPPDQWLPPNAGFHCTYVEMFVAVKHKFKLTVNDSERSAMSNVLNGC